MIELLVGVLTLIPPDLIPLDVPVSPQPVPTVPTRSGGFAAAIVGGFFGLGIIVLAAILLSLKPRRAQPPRPR